jgi:hypothetical protein
VEQGHPNTYQDESTVFKGETAQQNSLIETFSSFQISTTMSVLLNVIPFLTLIVLNILIWRTIKHKTFLLRATSKKERRDVFVAGILILIVILYTTCNAIKSGINVLELYFSLKGIKIC